MCERGHPGRPQSLGNAVRKIMDCLVQTHRHAGAKDVLGPRFWVLFGRKHVHGLIPFNLNALARALTAREQCVLTLPWEQPIAEAVSAKSNSSQ